MVLKDIIDDLTVRVKHTLSDNDIVRLINYALAEVAPVAGKNDIYRFNTTSAAMYPIPTYLNRIETVTVNGSEYLPRRLAEESGDKGYVISPDGFIIFLSPPKAGSEVCIFYRGARTLLTEGDVVALNEELSTAQARTAWESQDIDITEEFEQLIPLYVAAAAADSVEDIGTANNFRLQYNALYQRAQQARYIKRGKYPTTRTVQR